jgi:hypothetical protein
VRTSNNSEEVVYSRNTIKMNTTMNTAMNIPEVIATLERVIRLERGLPAKRTAVAAAQVAVEEASIGHKKVLARAALREAEEALNKQTQTLAELETALPPASAMSHAWAIRAVAEARVDRDHLQKAATAAEESLKEAQEAAKGGAWKWQGRPAKDIPESKEVVAARATIAATKEKLTALSKRVAPLVEIIEKEMEAQEERAESDAWAARGYTGETPAHILRAEAERQKEIEAGCEVIRIPKTREEWKAWAAARPVFVEKAEFDEYPDTGEDWAKGVEEFRRLLAGDFSSLMPKVEVEAVPVVKLGVRRRNKVGTTDWIEKMIVAKKAHRAAAAAAAALTSSTA